MQTRIAAAALAACLAFAMALPAAAQQRAGKTPPAVIAVIDSQRITREAAAFKSARPQIDQYRAAYQAELDKDRERLLTEDQELGRQRAILSPEAFEGRRRDLVRKEAELQKKVQDRARTIEQLFVGIRNDVGKVLIAIVQEMAGERGYNLVLDRAQVSYRADNLDITDEALKRLDQRLPTVKVSPPAGQ